MIITPEVSLCNDLLAIPLEDGVLDLSWSVDTDTLKTLLEKNDITKIINFQENIDFLIEIDNVDTFDSINLKQYQFSSIEQGYRGNIVFSAIIDFNKDKLEETNYYFRVKLINTSILYRLKYDDLEVEDEIIFEDFWSDIHNFTIQRNYTKDFTEEMYREVADFNAYNKEAKSANFYYIFKSFAYVLNKQLRYIIDEKNNHFINKALPGNLLESFGILLKFDDPYGLSLEEYRRILKNLIVAYQNGGAWNYIKQTIKYLIGYCPDLVKFDKFYPWILRENPIIEGYTSDNDPIYPFLKNSNYFDPETNFYLYKENFSQFKNNNNIMLLKENLKKFSFSIYSNNFFNRQIDATKVETILNLLKSTYTRYQLDLEHDIV